MGNMAADNAAGKRINSLLDAGSFVEIGGAVTARTTDFNMQEKETPADGVITGYGVIDGNLVYVYSQDATVLNGAIGEMHAKKISNIYDMAMKMGAPVIGLVDCAGFRLQEATDALEAFGKLYQKQSMASGVIPQITAIFGTCGGGLSIVPALTDFTFMEAKERKHFVYYSNNALEGNALDKVEVPVNFIVCKSGQEFSDYMTYLHNDGVYAWTTDEVDQLIKSKNKNASSDELLEMGKNYSIEDTIARHGK